MTKHAFTHYLRGALIMALLFVVPSCANTNTPMAQAMAQRLISESQPVMVQTANGPMMMAPQRGPQASSAFQSFYGGGGQ